MTTLAALEGARLELQSRHYELLRGLRLLGPAIEEILRQEQANPGQSRVSTSVLHLRLDRALERVALYEAASTAYARSLAAYNIAQL